MLGILSRISNDTVEVIGELHKMVTRHSELVCWVRWPRYASSP